MSLLSFDSSVLSHYQLEEHLIYKNTQLLIPGGFARTE